MSAQSTAANNFFVRLHSDTPFYRIFYGGLVPVKQVPVPNVSTTRGTHVMTFVTAALCGNARQPEPCAWLDWKRCQPHQRALLAAEVCRVRGGGEPREFLTYMDRGGDMPIRVSQTVDAPFPL